MRGQGKTPPVLRGRVASRRLRDDAVATTLTRLGLYTRFRDALSSGSATAVLEAGITQLVECKLPKLDVAGSSPVARST